MDDDGMTQLNFMVGTVEEEKEVLILYAVIQTDRQNVAHERIRNGALICMSCCGLPVGGMKVTICVVTLRDWLVVFSYAEINPYLSGLG